MPAILTQSFSTITMQKAYEVLAANPDITILDVRSDPEYRQGHIPGSVHLPGGRIHDIDALLPDKNTPLFVYCLSGIRSHHACIALAELGYSNLTNIGGIAQWPGHLEKGFH
ncbi:rhodanese-like domain-containing protein [Oscillospiraceae bacterium MB08-C2-2]|nr:rhodanese-like domain-containing protein [Oscillospiraceae bacterium MB08-C2-2]